MAILIPQVLVEDVVWVNGLVSAKGKKKENKSVRFHLLMLIRALFFIVILDFIFNVIKSVCVKDE